MTSFFYWPLDRVRAKIEKDTLCGSHLVRIVAKIEITHFYDWPMVRVRAKIYRENTFCVRH